MPNKKNEKIIPLVKENYLAVIRNSLDSKIFQNFYVKINGKKQDIMRAGELSCAFFVSSVTTLFGLSRGIHGTVVGVEKDLLESKWKKIKKPKIGSIIIWDEADCDNEKHKHIGFYIGNNKAISNSCFEKVPKEHDWILKDGRKVIGILWNNKLN